MSPNPTESINEFRPFPKLPTEIRIKIWKEICSWPRTIAVFERSIPSFAVLRIDKQRIFNSLTAIPATLHTSREARFIALKFYRPILGSSTSDLGIENGVGIYLNPDLDTLVPIKTNLWSAAAHKQFATLTEVPMRSVAIARNLLYMRTSVLDDMVFQKIIIFSNGSYDDTTFVKRSWKSGKQVIEFRVLDDGEGCREQETTPEFRPFSLTDEPTLETRLVGGRAMKILEERVKKGREDQVGRGWKRPAVRYYVDDNEPGSRWIVQLQRSFDR